MDASQIKLMRDTMDHILADREHHDQNYWIGANYEHPCKTTYCFAGHAAILAGYPDFVTYMSSNPLRDDLDWYDGIGITDKSVRDYAIDALGISATAACALFYSANLLETLKELVDRIIENNGSWYADGDD